MKKNNEQRNIPTYYGNMPAEVRYCKQLTASEKVLYCEFAALSNQRGYCWAANSYFAELYDVEPTTVSDWIQNLKKFGFISITSPNGRSRKISLLSILRKNIKDENHPNENVEAQPKEKPETNITSINTKNTTIVEENNIEENFNLENEIQRLLNYQGERNYFLRIMGIFIKRKKPDIRNKKQFNKFVKDYTWCAKQLEIYDNDQIIRAIKEAEQMVDSKTGQQWDWDLKNVINKIKKLKK